MEILERLVDMKTPGGRAAMIFQMFEKLDESRKDQKDTKKTD